MAEKPIAPMTNLGRLLFDLNLSSGGPVSVNYYTLHAMLRLIGYGGVIRKEFNSDAEAFEWLRRAVEEPKP